MTIEKAILGGGCFWCLDAAFRELRGVTDVLSGYAGGPRPNPSYEQVCSGASGHAEVVAITFDNSVLSFRDLLGIFFALHDPTTLNRQGHDIGTQYRSVVFCQGEEQIRITREVMAELEREKVFAAPIVTEVVEHDLPFWPAEDYHQDFFTRNPGQGYCQAVVAPKVARFRQKFAALRKA